MTPRDKRFYLAGYLRAKRQARIEREQLTADFFEVLDEVQAELSDVRSELERRYQIDEAASVERDPEMWAN